MFPPLYIKLLFQLTIFINSLRTELYWGNEKNIFPSPIVSWYQDAFGTWRTFLWKTRTRCPTSSIASQRTKTLESTSIRYRSKSLWYLGSLTMIWRRRRQCRYWNFRDNAGAATELSTSVNHYLVIVHQSILSDHTWSSNNEYPCIWSAFLACSRTVMYAYCHLQRKTKHTAILQL